MHEITTRSSRLHPSHWKISTRLAAGFAVIVAFTVSACLVAWASFVTSEQSMHRIEVQAIKGMVNALETASQQSTLSILIPDLARADSDTERAATREQLEDYVARINKSLDDVPAEQKTAHIGAMRALLHEINLVISNLDQLAVRRLEGRETLGVILNRTSMQHAAVLESLEAPLEDALLYMMLDSAYVAERIAGRLNDLVASQQDPILLAIEALRRQSALDLGANNEIIQKLIKANELTSAEVESITNSNAESIRQLLVEGEDKINNLYATKAEVNFIAGMLLAAANANDLQSLKEIEQRFRGSAVALRGSLQSLDAGADFPNLARSVRDLLNEGENQQSLFNLREQELSVGAELQRLLRRENDLTSRFNDLTEKLVFEAHESMNEEMAGLRSYLAGSSKLLLALAVISAVVGLFAALAITGSVVSGVQSLTKAMSALANDELEIDIPGLKRRDEVGYMARSVAVFKSNAIEKRRVEKRLDDYRRHLEDQVEKRTLEIREKQIQVEEALQKEKELNGIQRQFVSMVCHEFRTPLAIIDGNAQRLHRRLDNLPSDKQREILQKSRRAVSRLTDLMESVLSAARMENGQIKFDPAPCSLIELVNDVVSSYQELNPEREFLVDFGGLPEEIVADVKLLRQVLSNLISNAIKYSPGRTYVWIDGSSDEKGLAVITVRDDGLGIPAEEHEKLFQRFFRASTSTGIAGSGIGLHLAAHLLGLHGGVLDFESTEGEGTAFSMRMPHEHGECRPPEDLLSMAM